MEVRVTIRGWAMVLTFAGLVATAGPTSAESNAPATFDPSSVSRTITDCDRRAGHPDDPNHVGPGVASAAMDVAAAIEACRGDLVADPSNPRLQYQLARALTYGGHVTDALPLLEDGARRGYPQTLFVLGYLYLTGAYDVKKDACRAGELIRASAIAGRLAGQVGFPYYSRDGAFAGCAVKQDPAEMIGFLEAALASKPDYYPQLLARELLRSLSERPRVTRPASARSAGSPAAPRSR
jgi:hypothetical protein